MKRRSITLNTGSFEYSDIKDRDISYNYGGGVTLGSNRAGSGEKKNNSWSGNASYGYSERRQINFATVGEGNIMVRDGNTDLSKLKRDTSISQYGTVDVGFKGGVTIDSTTVAMIISPIKTAKDTYNFLKIGYAFKEISSQRHFGFFNYGSGGWEDGALFVYVASEVDDFNVKNFQVLINR